MSIYIIFEVNLRHFIEISINHRVFVKKRRFLLLLKDIIFSYRKQKTALHVKQGGFSLRIGTDIISFRNAYYNITLYRLY
jgi:hypothetical protein